MLPIAGHSHGRIQRAAVLSSRPVFTCAGFQTNAVCVSFSRQSSVKVAPPPARPICVTSHWWLLSLALPCVGNLPFEQAPPSPNVAQVNLAVALDGSGSVSNSDWELLKDFAKDAVVAFDDRNRFHNGGTASHVQFSSGVISSGDFTSIADYSDFVDADTQALGGTNIPPASRKPEIC